MLISRADEIINRHIPDTIDYSDITKRMFDEALDLCYNSIDVGDHAHAHYDLAQIYDLMGSKDNQRKAFDSCSTSIKIATDYPDARKLRIKIAQILIDAEDDLYFEEAQEALIEDQKYLG